MKPDFQIDKVKAYNVDCMEFMKELPDNYYDLAIVDPPYGIGADKKNNGSNSDTHEKTSLAKINTWSKTNWDNNVPNEDYFREIIRVSHNQIIWGINYYPYDFLSGGRIYWDKCVTMPTYSKGELAFCSKLNSIQSFRFAWHGMIQENMKEKETRIHPTQKPVQLYKWLLTNYAKEGDKILDTHGGSMTHARACLDLHFDLDICELDKEYFDKAVDGLKNNNQLYLF